MNKAPQTYLIQARLGNDFIDLYITAKSIEAALAEAKRRDPFNHRFTRYSY